MTEFRGVLPRVITCRSHTYTRQVLFQLLNFLNVVASGLVMWKALCLVTNSESPIVVVLS